MASIRTLTLVLLCTTSLQISTCGSLRSTTHLNLSSKNSVLDALFLTPYIENGEIEQGRELARVLDMGDIESYSGFLTVNPTYNSNTFFWFFPAKINPETAPVIVWLQGGPGLSSMFGLFAETGPFEVDADLNMFLRNTTWVNSYSMIYIDNPVGTGFSFTEDDLGYASTQAQIATELYEALRQFFILFPSYSSQEFFIAGESYAGKYIPNLALKIDEENGNGENGFINLKGLSLNVPYTDPMSLLQYGYGNHLYGVGLISSQDKTHFLTEEEKAIQAIESSNWTQVFQIMDALMDGVYGPSYFRNSTGYESYFNYLSPTIPPGQGYYVNYVNQDQVRDKIHVGDSLFKEYGKVGEFLEDDLYQSELSKLEQLLDSPQGYRILIISGQLDVIVPAVSLDLMLNKTVWSGTEEFREADRQKLRIGENEELAGYFKHHDVLTFATVLGGGHFLPYDQPVKNYEVVKRFISNEFS